MNIRQAKLRVLYSATVFSLLFSCGGNGYTCECLDTNGDIIVIEDSYIGNDRTNFLNFEELNLESEHGYTDCDCY